MIEISIVILTNNSLGVVNRLVDKLLPQLLAGRYELIFLDNNSTDGTVEYLNGIPFEDKRVETVEKGSFSHSGTRMWGARMCRGGLVVFFTDDVDPFTPDFLAQLVAPVANGKAVAACGVALINPATGDPFHAYRVNEWYRGFSDVVGPVTEDEWQEALPAQRRSLCNFDHCAACYKRSVLLRLALPDLPYGEDMGMAKRLITGGYPVALVKQAKFYHWHRVTFGYLFKRMCVDQIYTEQMFELVYLKSFFDLIYIISAQLLLYIFVSIRVPGLSVSERLSWYLYNIKFIFADNLGKYIGSIKADALVNKLFFGIPLQLKNEYHLEVLAFSIKRND
jgi:glycosyltransferase involved in cell wall biosynthesis